MKLADAKEKIDALAYKPFGSYLPPSQLEDAVKNKGKAGQLLELAIGLNLSNSTLDFEDGELKTNKCDQNGKPLETMFITQTSSMIDELLESRDFYSSKLYKKLSNLLYVPISKVGDPTQWMYLPCVHVDLSLPCYEDLKEQLEEDYYSICDQLNEKIQSSPDHFIHTSNGQFIQIRSKDYRPYSPIYSCKYGRNISNKNHAFYFKREFMMYITSHFSGR